MDSLYLYRDLLDCNVGLNFIIKRFYDVILKPTIKSCKAHYTRMIKKLKIQKVSRDLIQYSATKSKETRNKILGRENILA